MDRWPLFSSGFDHISFHPFEIFELPSCTEKDNVFFCLKAEKQLNSSWTLMRAGNPGVPTASEWVADVLASGGRVGIDPVSCSPTF